MKRPSFQYYPGDWVRSLDVRSCSIAARGMWLEILNIMHEAIPYGHLVINGKPISMEVLSRMAGVELNETTRLVAELEQLGVFSRDENGAIYCRRMVRDENFRQTRATNGVKGGYHTHKKNKSTKGVPKGVPKPVPKGVPNSYQDQYLSGTPSSSSSSSSSKNNDDDERAIIAGPPSFTPPPDLLPVPDIVTRLKADEQYLMNLTGAIRKPGLVWKPDWLKLMLDKFEAHLLSDDITHKSLHDFKRHFREWLKFQPQPQRINNEVY